MFQVSPSLGYRANGAQSVGRLADDPASHPEAVTA